MFTAKVVNFRKNAGEGPLGYFDILLGNSDDGEFTPLLTLKGAALRRAASTGKLFLAPPSKQRMDRKTNSPALNPTTGKPIYDPHYSIYEEKTGDKIRPTKAAYQLQDQIVAQAEALYNGLAAGDAGRGAPRPEKPMAKVAKTAPVAASNDDDDALPF